VPPGQVAQGFKAGVVGIKRQCLGQIGLVAGQGEFREDDNVGPEPGRSRQRGGMGGEIRGDVPAGAGDLGRGDPELGYDTALLRTVLQPPALSRCNP
jgi:hypothetical protein